VGEEPDDRTRHHQDQRRQDDRVPVPAPAGGYVKCLAGQPEKRGELGVGGYEPEVRVLPGQQVGGFDLPRFEFLHDLHDGQRTHGAAVGFPHHPHGPGFLQQDLAGRLPAPLAPALGARPEVLDLDPGTAPLATDVRGAVGVFTRFPGLRPYNRVYRREGFLAAFFLQPFETHQLVAEVAEEALAQFHFSADGGNDGFLLAFALAEDVVGKKGKFIGAALPAPEEEKMGQSLSQLCSALVAVCGGAFQATHHNGVQGLGDVVPFVAGGGDGFLGDHLHDVVFDLGVKQALAGDHLPHHDAEGEDVGSAVEALAPDLLRRHVVELALEQSRIGGNAAPGGVGDAKVEKLHPAVVAEKDVLRTDIPMHEIQRLSLPVGRLVDVGEAVGYLDGDPGDQGGRHRLAVLLGRPQQHAQVIPGEVLHDDVGKFALVVSGSQHLHHIGVVQERHDPAFLAEHLQEILVPAVVLQDQLDDGQGFLDVVTGQVHLGHPPGVQVGDHLEGAETLSANVFQGTIRMLSVFRLPIGCLLFVGIPAGVKAGSVEGLPFDNECGSHNAKEGAREVEEKSA
jgi:hypothetical protein